MAFPGLRYDDGFRITSPEDADYNCIAWALGRKDCWLWPDEDTDGVSIWPQTDEGDFGVQTFIIGERNLGKLGEIIGKSRVNPRNPCQKEQVTRTTVSLRFRSEAIEGKETLCLCVPLRFPGQLHHSDKTDGQEGV